MVTGQATDRSHGRSNPHPGYEANLMIKAANAKGSKLFTVTDEGWT